MTSWFAGQLLPGDRSTTTFTIDNPTNDTLSINVKPQILSLISKTQFNGTTVVHEQASILNNTDTFIPNYVKLSELANQDNRGRFFNTDNPIPDESSLMILNLNFQFNDFMNNILDVYADDIQIVSLYLYDWLDNNNDTKITSV